MRHDDYFLHSGLEDVRHGNGAVIDTRNHSESIEVIRQGYSDASVAYSAKGYLENYTETESFLFD